MTLLSERSNFFGTDKIGYKIQIALLVIRKMPCHNDSSDYPTFEEFQSSLGYPAFVLYGFGIFTSCLLLVQYVIMASNFFRIVPHDRIRQTFWINSVYSVVATLTTLGMI